jgi:hypothetical protein
MMCSVDSMEFHSTQIAKCYGPFWDRPLKSRVCYCCDPDHIPMLKITEIQFQPLNAHSFVPYLYHYHDSHLLDNGLATVLPILHCSLPYASPAMMWPAAQSRSERAFVVTKSVCRDTSEAAYTPLLTASAALTYRHSNTKRSVNKKPAVKHLTTLPRMAVVRLTQAVSAYQSSFTSSPRRLSASTFPVKSAAPD